MERLVGKIILAALVFGAGLYFLTKGGGMNPVHLNETEPESTVSQTKEADNKRCSQGMTPAATEGPYYKANSPEKTNIRDENISGEKFTLTGYVFDEFCNPIEDAWLDFWQADGEGRYDNQGYKLRGHQRTNENGMYILETVVPGEYPGRTPHIHVKVRANENSPIITSQLYLLGEAQNDSDSIFTDETVITITQDGDEKKGSYNFMIKTE